MSHIVTADLDLKNREAIEEAAKKVNARCLGVGSFDTFSGKQHGLGVQLRDWKYPLVVNLETGRVNYDNYGGSWGDQDRMDEFMWAYAAEVARTEIEERGFTLEETVLENGDLEMTVTNFDN